MASPYDELIPLGYAISDFGDGRMAITGRGTSFIAAADGSDVATVLADAKARATLQQKMIDGRAFFAANYANWPTMTAAQKDNANRMAQRAIANLMVYVLNALDSGD